MERKELPLSFTDFPVNCVQAHEFAAAFFVWNCIVGSQQAVRVWRDDNCWPIWKVVLSAGEVEKACIPYGAWSGASIEIVPTKAGMFFTSLQNSKGGWYFPGEAGLYKMNNDGSVEPILPGLIEHLKISPSGCKVAFVYAPHFMATEFNPPSPQHDRSKVAVIDVCSKP
jgi:hypothetical protein